MARDFKERSSADDRFESLVTHFSELLDSDSETEEESAIGGLETAVKKNHRGLFAASLFLFTQFSKVHIRSHLVACSEQRSGQM